MIDDLTTKSLKQIGNQSVIDKVSDYPQYEVLEQALRGMVLSTKHQLRLISFSVFLLCLGQFIIIFYLGKNLLHLDLLNLSQGLILYVAAAIVAIAAVVSGLNTIIQFVLKIYRAVHK